MHPELDIILLSIQRWDNPYSSVAFSLTKEFSKNNRVFYIDHPFSVNEVYRDYRQPVIRSRRKAIFRGKEVFRILEGYNGNIVIVTPRLTLPVNRMPEGKLYEWLSRMNDRVIWEVVRKIIARYQVKEFIFFNSFDPFFGRVVPPDIHPLLKVYQTIDDITQESYIARHGVSVERDQMIRADITLTTSALLTRQKLAYTPHVHLLANAADTTLFTRALEEPLPRPGEIEGISTPIIIYTGNMDRLRMDFDLLREVAQFHKDKTLVLVGPIDPALVSAYGLDRMPNILFTGPKPITDLPAFLKYADCAIIPFQCNTLTSSVYPLKINEYLAAGKPVVATGFSEDIKAFGQVAYIASGHADFPVLIDRAIAENDPGRVAERQAMARRNNWTARIGQFWEIADQYLAARRSQVPGQAAPKENTEQP